MVNHIFVNRRGSDRPKPAQSGFTLIELIATCALLGVLVTITIPTLVLIQQEKRCTEQRQFALQHVTNLLEHPVTRQWNELQPGELSLPDADTDLLAILPGVERSLTVTELNEDFPSRQLIASIRWRNHRGDFLPPIRISTWVFPTREDPQ